MEKDPDKVYGKNIIKKDTTVKDKKDTSKEASKIIEDQIKAEPNKTSTNANISALLKDTPKKKFYTSIEPMLATLVDKPFDDDEWIYEVKWDGYRAVTFKEGGKVEI